MYLGIVSERNILYLYVEANEPPLKLRWEKLSLQYALKLRSNSNNPAYTITFDPQCEHFYTSKPNAIKSFGWRMQDSLREVCPNLNVIATYRIPNRPPWYLKVPTVNLSLLDFKKDSTDPSELCARFAEIRDIYSSYKAIYTDGSKVLDRVACAALCPEAKCQKQARLPGSASIYTAELWAIKMAMDMVSDISGKLFVIFSDSLSSLLAIQGKNFNHPYLIDIFERYYRLRSKGKDVIFTWVPSHVGIKGNEKVDHLAREALDRNISFLVKIPHTDIKVEVNKYIKKQWQQLWDTFPDNKYYKIYPKVGENNVINILPRREEIVLARAKIGHTYFTHSYLLKGEQPPFCISCNTPNSVNHILIQCVEFSHIRNNHFNVPDLQTLFNTVLPSKIISYIKEIGLFKKF